MLNAWTLKKDKRYMDTVNKSVLITRKQDDILNSYLRSKRLTFSAWVRQYVEEVCAQRDPRQDKEEEFLVVSDNN